jgi:hypothetical protein
VHRADHEVIKGKVRFEMLYLLYCVSGLGKVHVEVPGRQVDDSFQEPALMDE